MTNAVIKSLHFPKLMFLFCFLMYVLIVSLDDKTGVGLFTATYIIFLNNILGAVYILFLNSTAFHFVK